MEFKNRKLTCPYCFEDFETKDILFCADPSEDFASLAEKDMFNSDSGVNLSFSGTKAGLKNNGQKNKQKTISLFGDPEPVEEEKVEAESTEPEFPLGENVEDTVAEEFMLRYGRGGLFKYTRSAVFYRIKAQSECSEADKTSGWVDSLEGEDEEKGIPGTLFVPSRPETSRTISKRVCPKCHCDIPDEYFLADEGNIHHVALAGCSASGKTQYIIIAIRELMNMFSNLNLGTVSLTNFSKQFHKLYLDQYTKNGGRLNATPMDYRIFPFMLKVSPENGNVYYLIFHDVAGEYARVSDETLTYLLNKTAFRKADSIMAMFDCAQFCHGDSNITEDRCNEEYLAALRPLGKYGQLREKLKTGVAVITKCDGIFGRQEYIHGSISAEVNDGMVMVSEDMSTHRNSLNTTVIDSVEAEILAVLDRCMGLEPENGIKQHMMKILKNCIDLRVLPVSTYVRKSDDNGSVKLVKDEKAITGHFRLIEPILYLMCKLEMIPGVDKGLTNPGTSTDNEGPDDQEKWWEKTVRKISKLFSGE